MLMTAGPFFGACPPNMVLDKSDCSLVQVIHTSAEQFGALSGIIQAQFGTASKSGHCDFWINCGFTQVPCQKTLANGTTQLDLIGSALRCSHSRSHMI